MRSKIRSILVVALSLVGSACALQQASPTWVADITAAAGRYYNRQVVVEGQVTRVEADPVGTTRGRYLLVDESDEQGIIVTSKELPAPGEMLRVEGSVVQDPRNAARPVLRESQRAAPTNNRLRIIIIVAAVLAVLLVGALVYMLLQDDDDKGGKEADDRPIDTTIGQEKKADPVTQEFKMPKDEVTETFEYWGVELVVVEGPDTGKHFQVGVSPLLVGRKTGDGRKNHVALTDQTISRDQATITRNKTSQIFSLRNESKRNNTMVNGREVDSCELAIGDKVRFGASVLEFRKAT